MKNKTVLVLFIALSATMLVFTGCGNKENDTVPVVSEEVEEIETTTPIKETEIVEDISEVTTADDIETNYGKGYDLNGKHYDTRTEYIEAC